MPKTLGYMITWTTYGTWLQGDQRGYLSNGKILPSNTALANSNANRLTCDPVRLSKDKRQIAHDAIITKAKKLNHNILAISISSTHIHLVLQYSHNPLGRIVAHYKNAVRIALHATGLKGKIWSSGYHKRYCFNNESLNQRIAYVRSHKNT